MQNWQGLHRVSAQCWNWAHIALLTAALLHHYTIGSYQSIEKMVYESSYIATLNQFFTFRFSSFLDCSSWISRSDKINPYSWLNFFIVTYYSAAPTAQPLILQLNLQLSHGIVFWSDCQMICRGSNLDSNLTSAAWPTSCIPTSSRGFVCS